jgi:hypothetical protein
MESSPWITGNDANAMNAGIDTVVGAVGSIFSTVGANRYAVNTRFKHDDVVVLETARDSNALIAGVGTLLLLIVVLIVTMR